MKKLVAMVMTLSLVLALTACDGGKDGTSSNVSSTAPVSSSVSSEKPVSSEPEISVPTVSVEPDQTLAEKFPLNLAFQGTAIVDSDTTDYAGFTGGPTALNDGDMSTRWQSGAKKNENDEALLESEEAPSWFGIQWEEAKTFDTIVCTWEAAHPLADGFRVEISEDGETWTAVEFASDRTGTYNDGLETLDTDKQVDTITLTEAATTKAVRVYCFTYYTVPEGHENEGNTKSPTSCYEIEISYSVDVEAAEDAEDVESTESTQETESEETVTEE